MFDLSTGGGAGRGGLVAAPVAPEGEGEAKRRGGGEGSGLPLA